MAIEVIDYQYANNADLFRINKFPDGISQTAPTELWAKLRDILRVAYDQREIWGNWQYPEESRYAGPGRTFTPWFGEFTVVRGLHRATIDQRLHIKLGGGPIIHTERRVTAGHLFPHGTFAGFEIMRRQPIEEPPQYGPFLEGADPNAPSIHIMNVERGYYVNPPHIGSDPTYWNSVTAIVNEAHKEFVPAEALAEAAAS